MKCSECGTEEGEIKEYMLSFGLNFKEDKLFNATYERYFCKECAISNVTLLKNELEFMHTSDNIPSEKGKLNIIISEDFLKTT